MHHWPQQMSYPESSTLCCRRPLPTTTQSLGIRPALCPLETCLSPRSALRASSAAAVTAAPAPSLSPQAQQLLSSQTLSSPQIKADHIPLSSLVTLSHPTASAGRHPLHSLDLGLTATHTANTAPSSRLTPPDVIPLLVTTGAHEAQSVA